MKKKILVVVLLFAAITGIGTSLLTPNKKKDADLKQFLSEAGFVKVPGIITFDMSAEKNYWWDNYGLYFLSFSEMDSLCLANNFIIGGAERFKESIPDAAIKTMKENYSKVDNELLTYAFRDWLSRGDYLYYFSSEEVGWWLRGEERQDHWDYGGGDFLRSNLIHRLTKKGNKVLNDVYNIHSMPTWEMARSFENEKIYVVADASKFDTSGMSVVNHHLIPPPPKPDPIAVIKHRKGYVILAKW